MPLPCLLLNRAPWLQEKLSEEEPDDSVKKGLLGSGCTTHRPQSSSFLGLPHRILDMSRKKGTTLECMGKPCN